jgi:hypothetical protein
MGENYESLQVSHTEQSAISFAFASFRYLD